MQYLSYDMCSSICHLKLFVFFDRRSSVVHTVNIERDHELSGRLQELENNTRL